MTVEKTLQIDENAGVHIHLNDDANQQWGLEKVIAIIEDSLPVLTSFLHSKNTCLDNSKQPIIEVELQFCDDTQMKEINSEHRGKDKTTDVLSFPMYESLRPGSDDFILPGPVLIGDIIISREVAAKQAKEFDLEVEQEVIHLFCHGMLHLLGYDHEASEEEEVIMEGLEKELLEDIKKIRNK